MRPIFLLLLACWSLSAAVRHTATVVETMNAGGYTYMNVRDSGDPYWVAVTMTPVKVGERISFNEAMWMSDFKSRALDRRFEKILFATMDTPASGIPEAVKSPHAPAHVMAKAADSLHIEEVFAKRQSLAGKTVAVRGKVTKVSRGIMKRNWVHIEDGTGGAMSDDLVFTTTDPVTVTAGETVIATGTATVNKDFGYGYFYPILIEKSGFTPER